MSLSVCHMRAAAHFNRAFMGVGNILVRPHVHLKMSEQFMEEVSKFSAAQASAYIESLKSPPATPAASEQATESAFLPQALTV